MNEAYENCLVVILDDMSLLQTCAHLHLYGGGPRTWQSLSVMIPILLEDFGQKSSGSSPCGPIYRIYYTT